MMGFIITVHVIVCVLLIMLILIQRGHGGGLLESFSGVESMFGTKTNELLARITTISAVIFFITCIGLALFSAKQGKSLMMQTTASQQKAKATPAQPQAEPQAEQPVQQVPPRAPAQPANPTK